MKGIFRPPVTTVNTVKEGDYSPVKAILYGLLISVVLASLVSMIESIIFSILTEAELGIESQSVTALANSVTFLTINVAVYSLIMYYAGTVVKKFTPSQEAKFGAIVSTMTFVIYFFLFIGSDSFSEFPAWYNVAVFTSIIVALNYGAKRKI